MEALVRHAVTDRRGAVTTYGYTPGGQVSALTDAENQVTLQGLYGEGKEIIIVKGNLEFDWGYWSKTLDIEVDDEDRRPGWITSPAQMVQDEFWRRSRVERGVQDASSFPCDYFVYGLGEPPKPWMTKFWGVPYRSRALPWPQADDYPIPFRAQLNFTGSKDIVGDLPGDLLLVFCDPDEVCEAVFEWGSTSIADPISMDEARRFLPAIESVFLDFCCYGERFRSFDLYPDDNTFYSSVTCIGGASNFDVPNMRRYNTETRCLEWANSTKHVGRYLGRLGPAIPLFGVDYPWINQKKALDREEFWEISRKINPGGVHQHYLFVKEDGTVCQSFNY